MFYCLSFRLFNTKGINSVMFIQEQVIMAKCAKRGTATIGSLDDHPGILAFKQTHI